MKKSTGCFLPAMAGVFLIIAASAPSAWARNTVIRIAATGDIMLGTQNNLPADGAAGAFAEVGPYLQNCQVVIGNLEGPLTDRGAPTKNVVEGQSYVFRSPPAYVERLREAGFTIMSLANNHVNDYGPAGSAQTREVLEGAGLLHTGAPRQAARQVVGRNEVSVIGLAPNKGCQDINDLEAAVEMVRQEAARPNALVIVVFHGGAEGAGRVYVPHGTEYYLGENRGDLRKLGRALIDAGAHLIIGHGPHVPRGLEIYKDRLIAYSLGNFATGRGISISGRTGLAPLLLVEMTTQGQLKGGQVLSFKQREAGRPRLDLSGEAVALMHKVSLGDFTAPALDREGRLMLTEKEALAMAATSAGPATIQIAAAASEAAKEPRPTKTETEAVTAVKVAQETRPVTLKPKAKQPADQNVSRRYEWDIYSNLKQ